MQCYQFILNWTVVVRERVSTCQRIQRSPQAEAIRGINIVASGPWKIALKVMDR